jgi:hypothetical protein
MTTADRELVRIALDMLVKQEALGQHAANALLIEWDAAHREPVPAIGGEVEIRDAWGRKLLTVGHLRHLIANLDDTIHVLIGVPDPDPNPDDDEWRNIGTVGIPPADIQYGGDYTALTLYSDGTPFDSRQF